MCESNYHSSGCTAGLVFEAMKTKWYLPEMKWNLFVSTLNRRYRINIYTFGRTLELQRRGVPGVAQVLRCCRWHGATISRRTTYNRFVALLHA